MTSASSYLPSKASFAVFPYPYCLTASCVSPEMYSLQRDKDIQVLSAYMSQCYQPSFRGMQFQSTYNEKPTLSYIGLISKAILSSPQQKLVLGDIYTYILTHYPYFRNKGPGWRNSIRHNLSLNDCFVKVGRSPNGKGHFWAINPINYDDFSRGDYKRKKALRKNWENSTTRGEGLKTRKVKIPCDIISCKNGLEKRGFHIETLLAIKQQ